MLRLTGFEESPIIKNSCKNLLLLLLAVCCFFLNIHAKGQVIDYSTLVKTEKGKRITEKSFTLQINSKESEWLSHVNIPYSADQKLEILEAYVVNASGVTIRNLKKKEITTKSNISSGAFYEDDFIKEFKLNWNTYPYQVKYKYRVTDTHFIFITKWYPFVHYDIPTLKASLQVELPLGEEVSLDFSEGFQYETKQQDGKQYYQWELHDFSAVQPEVFSPPVLELVPSVSVVPRKFNYAIRGSSESWAAYGTWHDLLNKDADILPPEEGDKINKLIEGANSKAEVVKILYHYMQDHTRYINVAIDVGGLKPYPASFVCEKKYGDCKALTVYMKALLKHAGIPSFYTIVYAGSNPVKINRNLPSQQFNHVILSVPIDGDTLWLENTANYFPYNYLGTFTQNRYALLVDGENSRLVKTPSLELQDVSERGNYVFKLDQEGNGRVSITKRMKGKAFEEYAYYSHELGEKDQKLKIEQDISLNNSKLTQWNIDHMDRDQQELKLELELNVTDQLRKIGRFYVIQPVFIEIPPLEDPDLRKNPVRINCPINKSDSIVYELPFTDKFEVKLPDSIHIETIYGKYTEHCENDGKNIVVKKIFQLYAADYPKEAYKDFFLFIASINKTQKQSAIILTQHE